MYHSFLIHSSANGHLGCFHVLAIVIRASVNIEVHKSLSIIVFSFMISIYSIETDTCLKDNILSKKNNVKYENIMCKLYILK